MTWISFVLEITVRLSGVGYIDRHMRTLTNEAWLQGLERPGVNQKATIEALRDFLLRAVLVYLRRHRSDLAEWSPTEVQHFAEDTVQEALLAIKNNLDKFRGDSKFTTWAYRFAINQAASELRRSRYRDLSLEGLQERETAILFEFAQEERKLAPDIAAERRAFAELLGRIIRNELTERQRLAIVAVHFQGRSMQEVAEQMDLNRNALYKLLHDARRKIKAQLQAQHLSAGDVLALFEG